LLAASAWAIPLGLPTLFCAGTVCLAIALYKRASPLHMLQHLAWSVLALVGGLFVLVQGLQNSGTLQALTSWLQQAGTASPASAALLAGSGIALASNLVNNLPAGLIAGSVVASAQVAPVVQSAIVIGVDLGPNLSITGSLATLLWLVAIRREGEQVSAWQFLKVGAIAMPVALALALLGLLLQETLTALWLAAP
jgi:arsenical pump membrane protein